MLKYLTILCMFALNSVLASEQLSDPCSSIIVVGDSDWPPYYVSNSSQHRGAGVTLVTKIAKELDIPIVVSGFTDKRNMLQAFTLGDVDILVSSYNVDKIEKRAHILDPPYTYDPIVVAINKKNKKNYKSFDDFIGSTGRATRNSEFDTQSVQYISKYLYVARQGGLTENLNLLRERKIDFMIGSKNQIQYGIAKNKFENEIKILNNLRKGGDVYLAFSKKSACSAYEPYFAQRLRELKTKGVVQRLIDEQIKVASN